jgi:RNA polymerase sigma factor (sigma-70 family)
VEVRLVMAKLVHASAFRKATRDRGDLVVAHRPLVLAEVSRWCAGYWRAQSHRDDLIQEGMIGLLYAARLYDSRKTVMSFGAYARTWVRQRLRMAILRLGPVSTSNKRPVGEAMGMQEHELNPETDGGSAEPVESLPRETLSLFSELREVLTTQYGKRKHSWNRRPQLAARDIAIWERVFLCGEKLDPTGAPHGLSRERVRQIVVNVSKVFEQWAKEVREEAG